MVYLHTYISCRAFTIEHVHLDILHVLKNRTYTNTEIGLGNLREGCETCLEVSLLTFHLVLKVGSQWLVAQGRNKNRLRHHRRIGRYCIRQLVNVTKETCFEQGVDDSLSVKFGNIPLAEIHKTLLSVGIHLYTEHFSTFTTHDGTHRTTDWRGKLHLRILFVHKQRIPGLNLIAFLNDNLRRHTLKVIRHQSVFAV